MHCEALAALTVPSFPPCTLSRAFSKAGGRRGQARIRRFSRHVSEEARRRLVTS